MSFYGRENEIHRINETIKKNGPQLIVCSGRRRVGKSYLIRHVGAKQANYVEIQGIAPAPDLTNQHQINNFIKEFCEQEDHPLFSVSTWRDLFKNISKHIGNKRFFLFMDEISWMGHHDPKFTGELKISWDTEFKSNKKLVLVLCGSVSTWINKNILYSKDFMGRINVELPIQQLPIKDAFKFWKKPPATREFFTHLCISGGIPRYLENINQKYLADKDIAEQSFNTSGIFYNEFIKIFNDIFEGRSKSYQSIVYALSSGTKTMTEICQAIGVRSGGKYVEYLKDLESAGFIKGFNNFALNENAENKITKKITYYRIIDPYLRFYLKVIFPNIKKIEAGVFNLLSLSQIKGFEAFLGHQFEMVILNNLNSLVKILRLNPQDILEFGPYYQRPTLRKNACQIDLVIKCKKEIYIFEIKSSRSVDTKIINEIESKIDKIKIPKGIALHKGLIHSLENRNDLSEQVKDYFDLEISLEDFIHVPNL
jgi:AAA+ ATPase superfamily predicted ATPase